MRVMLISPSGSREVMPLSMALFSTLLKREGHRVGWMDVAREEGAGRIIGVGCGQAETSRGRRPRAWVDLIDTIEAFGPDLVALSVVEDRVPVARRLSAQMRQRGVLTLWGGAFPTFAPEKAIAFDEVDLICVGEGERALTQLCRRMERGKPLDDIPNLWVKDRAGRIRRNALGPLIDVNELPVPDFGLFEGTRFHGAYQTPLETHRGCPYACAFCCAPPLNALYRKHRGTPFFRKKKIAAIRSSLEAMARIQEPQSVFFFADTLLAWSAREFDAFVACYADFKWPFMCYARPETITEERLERLVSLGLKLICIGIQHGNERFRRRVVRRGMNNSALARVFHLASQFPVWVHADSMVGFPDETPELAMDTVAFNRTIPADSRACSIFVPYHGAPLRQMAVERGYLDAATIVGWTEGRCHLNMPRFPSHLIERIASNFHHWVHADQGEWAAIQRENERRMR